MSVMQRVDAAIYKTHELYVTVDFARQLAIELDQANAKIHELEEQNLNNVANYQLQVQELTARVDETELNLHLVLSGKPTQEGYRGVANEVKRKIGQLTAKLAQSQEALNLCDHFLTPGVHRGQDDELWLKATDLMHSALSPDIPEMVK